MHLFSVHALECFRDDLVSALVIFMFKRPRTYNDELLHLNVRVQQAQRQFQSSLLSYIKLLEVLALLKPSIMPSVRDSYAEIVAEGILSKKRLKNYFITLPGKSSVNMEMHTVDLGIYPPVALRSSPITDPNHQHMKPAQAKDVEIALSELLPVVSDKSLLTCNFCLMKFMYCLLQIF